MISIETAQAILSEIAARNGIESGLHLDENSHCAVGPGDEPAFHIAFSENDGSFILAGLVGPLAEEAQAASPALRFLLASNLYWHETGGATLALEPESGFVVLQKKLKIPPDAEEDFRTTGVELVESEMLLFEDLLGSWQKRYVAFLREDPEDEDDKGPFEPAEPSFIPNFDLRV